MLSSALAGILRAGAVVLTAGALGGGVYFLVQAGDSQDDAARLQAPSGPTATVEAPRDLSPPGDLSGPVDVQARPTPTFPPAPLADPGIDTSDWKTYVSPLGFTLKYPGNWVVDEQHDLGLPLGTAAIGPRHQPEEANQPSPGPGFDRAGAAWIEINPIRHPSRFDVEELFGLCLPGSEPPPDRPPNKASTQTFAGRPAVLCVSEGPTPAGDWLSAQIVWVELPSGGVVGIASYSFESTSYSPNPDIVSAALLTLSFGASP